MECQCDQDRSQDAGWWMSGNSLQMGVFTVVGYLLYRFSQTLPALIRWPIRLFCSLTGLTALWGWVSRLVGTLRGIRSLCKWLSRIWRFFVGSSGDDSSNAQTDPNSSVRLILLGHAGSGRTCLADTLLGNTKTLARTGQIESNMRRTVVDGKDLTVIDTPDLLGGSLRKETRAKEALRSLQFTSPGPHAFLLLMQAPGSSMGTDPDAAQLIRAARELYGEAVSGYIIPVLTHADRLGKKASVDELLEADAGSLKKAYSLCSQKPELVGNGPSCPPEAQSTTRRNLVARVMELRGQRGHFIHELQRTEDRYREELLADMAAALAKKLGRA
ncbi:GTPase IMAP family member 1-like [Salarias fasciatus]|uniref:GTPase IMAP family member 1-like n=1 Tax=Salarias fasciatus TaxID=181472 RepID=A0A672FTS2_SALFA|nr:GTPase IMAP family member 1-like [Salarias fasciatus]